MLVNSAGLFRETRFQSLIQAAINIVVAVALTPRMGMAGVLLGTIAANLYRCVDLIFFIPRHVTNLPPMDTIRRVVRMGVLFAVAVVPVVLWLSLTPGGWMGWILHAGGGGESGCWWCLLSEIY